MALLKTSAHVQNQTVRVSYPGSAGVMQPDREQLTHARGSEFWHLRVDDDEAERLHEQFGTTFRPDEDAI